MTRFRDKFNLDRNSPCGQQDSLERYCSSPWWPWHLSISCSIHDTICTVQRGHTARSAPPRLDAQKAEKFITLGLPVTSCQKRKSCHGNKPQKRKCGYYDQTLLSPSWETMLLWGDISQKHSSVPQSLQGQRLQLFKPRSRNLSVVDSRTLITHSC